MPLDPESGLYFEWLADERGVPYRFFWQGMSKVEDWPEDDADDVPVIEPPWGDPKR